MHAVLGTTSNHTRHSAGRGAPIPPAGKAAAGTGSSPPEGLVSARIEAKRPFSPDPQERDSRVQRVNVLLDVRVGPLSALHVSQRLGEPARDHLRVEAHRLHARCIPPNGGAQKRMWAKPQSIGVHGSGPGLKFKIGFFMIFKGTRASPRSDTGSLLEAPYSTASYGARTERFGVDAPPTPSNM